MSRNGPRNTSFNQRYIYEETCKVFSAMLISRLSPVGKSSVRLENIITPDSSNPVPIEPVETKKYSFKKRLPTKVNLLNRYPRSAASTPRYASFHDEASNDDRLSKSDVVIYEKRKVSRDMATKVFNFDVLPVKEDAIAKTELETSVFLHSSSASSDNCSPRESNRELPFVSPK